MVGAVGFEPTIIGLKVRRIEPAMLRPRYTYETLAGQIAIVVTGTS